jgi:hypothetical protein
MFSSDQKEYSEEFYVSVIQDIVQGTDIRLIEEVLRVLEDEEDYEGCAGLIKGLERAKTASKEELLDELDELGIYYPKKLRKK